MKLWSLRLLNLLTIDELYNDAVIAQSFLFLDLNEMTLFWNNGIYITNGKQITLCTQNTTGRGE